MGFFGCSHKWKKYGRPNYGVQQWACKRCGRLRNKKVSTFWCSHQWRKDRRRKQVVLTCKKCSKVEVKG